MSKIALITGATAGFGLATARIFAKNGLNLIITGRRNERLLDLQKELVALFNVKVLPLCFDVRHQKAVEQNLGNLSAEWSHVDILVNNAGLAAGFSTIDNGNLEDWETMIDTNLKGLLYVSRTILPGMKARRSGHVVNIGSIAGKETYRFGNVYCATKHAVDSLTKAMRIDLLPFNIKVTGICPGAAETEFSLVRYKGDADKANSVYKGFEPLVAQDIAEIIWFAVNRPWHVNLNDIVVTPTAQANAFYIEKANN
ncbi:MAG TPA: SDR family NAD(P)-dependent oxidoreductase [Flavobacteriales bacterium]|nr:SDR family NAD(P)-dependent oxidoreductase [Flavobacteriales bacterium]